MSVRAWVLPLPQSHSVRFYQDDRFLIDELSQFIGSAIAAGDSAIVIATNAHREKLAHQLANRGVNVFQAAEEGRFLSLDASDTLAKFMVCGRPDREQFNALLGPLIARLEIASSSRSKRVAAFGEMVALLWAEGKRDAAIALEKLWNDLSREHAFHLHCAYPMHLFSDEADRHHLAQVCTEHSHVVPTERFTDITDDEERLRSIVLLQQKAEALETELGERKKTEEAVYRLAAIVESSDDAIISKDLNSIVTSWNTSAERILGYKAEEMLGKSVTLIIPRELQSEEDMILSKVRAGQRVEHFQTVRVRKDGTRIDVALTISPVKDRNGRIVGAAKILRDITEQKQLEEALRTTERLASVGRLAATVAHELNNPLEAVTNFVYLARLHPELPEGVGEYLDAADKELRRAAHIAKQTLGFYRGSSPPALFLVSDLMEEVLSFYERRLLEKRIHLEKSIEPGLTLHGWREELKQVISNLIVNALQATPEAGKIVIRARRDRLSLTGDPGVRITIADTGTGISPMDRNKLFTPFFTTKEAIGTGLGLWIIKQLLERRHGRIRFRTRDVAPSGSVMSFWVPSFPGEQVERDFRTRA